MKMTNVSLAVLMASVSSQALAFGAADARSTAMGGTGVASSNYLMAAFHNPAQTVNFTGSDDFGLLLGVNLGAHDSDDLYNKIDHFQQIDEELEYNNQDQNLQDEWRAALRELDNGSLSVDTSVGIAVAIPNKYLSMNMFAKANVATIAMTDVVDSDLVGTPDSENMQSTVHGLIGGTVDVGIAMARAFDLPFQGQRVSVGVTPKAQHIVALNYKNTVSGFEEDDVDLGSEYQEATVFNADMGISYMPTQYLTLGLAAKNIFAQELETNVSYGTQATFLVEPKYTAGIAFNSRLLTVAADYDISATRYFKEVEHETQFARVGAELNAWDWAQVRAGYSLSLTDYAQDTVTAGVGFKPFGAFGFDLGAYYGEDNNYGVSAQIVLTL
ncbi:conjugal transfer protein TraF [Enterovibrio calviensis]|uniref:conjugal transfer protein TraF n=1 Tax=Enterovibrio calviensis TaxID=91359 RepID=UPI000487A737|nr:conjugal transfer protein TraF [Enterovibrio calviensis]